MNGLEPVFDPYGPDPNQAMLDLILMKSRFSAFHVTE